MKSMSTEATTTPVSKKRGRSSPNEGTSIEKDNGNGYFSLSSLLSIFKRRKLHDTSTSLSTPRNRNTRTKLDDLPTKPRSAYSKKKLADVHATSPLPVVNLSKNKLKSNKEKQNDSSAIYYQFLDKQQNKTEKVEKKSDLVISSVGKKTGSSSSKSYVMDNFMRNSEPLSFLKKPENALAVTNNDHLLRYQNFSNFLTSCSTIPVSNIIKQQRRKSLSRADPSSKDSSASKLTKEIFSLTESLPFSSNMMTTGTQSRFKGRVAKVKRHVDPRWVVPTPPICEEVFFDDDVEEENVFFLLDMEEIQLPKRPPAYLAPRPPDNQEKRLFKSNTKNTSTSKSHTKIDLWNCLDDNKWQCSMCYCYNESHVDKCVSCEATKAKSLKNENETSTVSAESSSKKTAKALGTVLENSAQKRRKKDDELFKNNNNTEISSKANITASGFIFGGSTQKEPTITASGFIFGGSTQREQNKSDVLSHATKDKMESSSNNSISATSTTPVFDFGSSKTKQKVEKSSAEKKSLIFKFGTSPISTFSKDTSTSDKNTKSIDPKEEPKYESVPLTTAAVSAASTIKNTTNTTGMKTSTATIPIFNFGTTSKDTFKRKEHKIPVSEEKDSVVSNSSSKEVSSASTITFDKSKVEYSKNKDFATPKSSSNEVSSFPTFTSKPFTIENFKNNNSAISSIQGENLEKTTNVCTNYPSTKNPSSTVEPKPFIFGNVPLTASTTSNSLSTTPNKRKEDSSTTSTSVPAALGPVAAVNPPMFHFGSSVAQSTTMTPSKTLETSTASKPAFTFGSASGSSTFTFGSANNNTQTASVPSSKFEAPSPAVTSAPPFNSSATTTTSSTSVPPIFASSSSSTPSFQLSTNNNQGSQTTSTKQPSFSFGASTSSAAAPFGASAPASFNAPTHAAAPFGAPAAAPFGASTPAAAPFGVPTPTVAPFGAPTPASAPFGAPTPAAAPFGTSTPTTTSFGAPNSSTASFGAPTPAAAPFGATTPAAGFQTNATTALPLGKYNASNNAASFTFGTTSSSNFGPFSSSNPQPAAPLFSLGVADKKTPSDIKKRRMIRARRPPSNHSL